MSLIADPVGVSSQCEFARPCFDGVAEFSPGVTTCITNLGAFPGWLIMPSVGGYACPDSPFRAANPGAFLGWLTMPGVGCCACPDSPFCAANPCVTTFTNPGAFLGWLIMPGVGCYACPDSPFRTANPGAFLGWLTMPGVGYCACTDLPFRATNPGALPGLLTMPGVGCYARTGLPSHAANPGAFPAVVLPPHPRPIGPDHASHVSPTAHIALPPIATLSPPSSIPSPSDDQMILDSHHSSTPSSQGKLSEVMNPAAGSPPMKPTTSPARSQERTAPTPP
ncbi:hypothetical protein EV702DRAFT_1225183 [Suillus placidus]|uniref:Uncharacterized protein n=1 Tax=Suillus placidus TaxID=48579 RepID=A0A9P6ZVN1_9AGAM|nr:hypothetical protein EV702DRAFT_1225183 [Suillus placidus]